MPSAGAVCPPLIVAVRRQIPGLATNKIDTTTLIEITTGIKLTVQVFLWALINSKLINMLLSTEYKVLKHGIWNFRD